MRRTGAATWRAAGAAGLVRALPGQLRADLWTVSGTPPGEHRPSWRDWSPALVVPLTLCALALFVGDANAYANGYGLTTGPTLLIAGAQSAALVGALFRPVPAWWVSLLAMAALTPFATRAYAVAGAWTGFGVLLQAGVLLLLALGVRARAAFEALAVTLLTSLAADLVVPGPLGEAQLTAAAALVATVLVGVSLRARQVARGELVVQEGLVAGERSRRAQLEERHRIARELHDVVAHHMSVISIQAQVAPHLTADPSPELRENLAGIRANAVDALTELRRVLGVLRSEEALARGVRHAPQPTLDRLEELLDGVRDTGRTVTARTVGERRPLPPGIELSAFRIVQEALSNALRHAPGSALEVEVGYRPSGVLLRVANSAPQAAVPSRPEPLGGRGHGLLGMRERAAMLGGELAAGATPDGGWEVTALLPVPRPARSAQPAQPAQPAEDA